MDCGTMIHKNWLFLANMNICGPSMIIISFSKKMGDEV